MRFYVRNGRNSGSNRTILYILRPWTKATKEKRTKFHQNISEVAAARKPNGQNDRRTDGRANLNRFKK